MTEHELDVKNNVFGFGSTNDAFAKFFTGDGFINGLVHDETISVGVSHVSFAPGSRNYWHIHRNGYQILLVTAGEGWYQEDGQPARKLKAGDVVVTKEGVTHWHGATKHSWFSHITITEGTQDWVRPVTDKEYNLLEKK
ncbi:hypothetical protein AYR62_05525 [Secundilactobacillus paracollinoides]|uniref:Cupin type-2 domain-containing protein n=1 Tax=Secundilactobacillus paracollinoides TaxID=240427 RepID=A0A1B2J0K3_9LACO|nr:cupin domain-containing protein [Secundilactobacillus paracollinoides]ANZ63606.1 hypothetical protein AYR62_05525 [Secundilactobacillus paracollinoides]ANZ67866.1 hypothetical protein AYR63_12435 [Secundilactobacillus paracollinoides]KRL79274.1 cupin domain protein [Secundilactobacillus paracollinoides DSM 15502 = JCM 11969]